MVMTASQVMTGRPPLNSGARSFRKSTIAAMAVAVSPAMAATRGTGRERWRLAKHCRADVKTERRRGLFGQEAEQLLVKAGLCLTGGAACHMRCPFRRKAHGKFL